MEVLNIIPLDHLSKIYLAWYGNRELEYDNNESSIFPKSCNKCHPKLMGFYKHFLENNDPNYRKNLIENLIKNTDCDCYNKLLGSIG